jgi:serine/threonine-protein kinase
MNEAFKFAPHEWALLRSLLDEALALPAGARERWLHALPDERAAGLKPRLQALLVNAQDDEPGTAARLLETLPKVETGQFAPPPGAGEKAGDIVGPYRLMRELGSGGMGSVWLAEHTDLLQGRQVALKLPHGAWKRAGLAERLARERAILATLEHRHIARLYDAGVTVEGQPWLALEYVDGQRIDAHCRARALAVRERLQLFLQVARAVAHAHAQLVVHRDLKPANILVTSEGDGAGDVKLLDFGIAKLVAEGVVEETELTREVGRAFTPEYASPEQILGKPLGTASDVYSLGVVLFELLADVRPYKLNRASRAALEEAVAEAAVPRPSALAPAARRRALRGELDTIVLKALKREPAERYATVAALADDVQRHLERRPVLAQPDSAWYRLRTFARRHAVAIGVGGAIAGVLTTGAAVSAWQAAEARAAQRRAESVRNFVAQMLLDANPFTSRGREPTVEALLLAARQRLPRAEGANAPLRVELLTLIGSGLQGLGKYEPAEQALRAAIDEGTREVGPHHPLTLGARVALTSVHRFKGREADTLAELGVLIPLLRAAGPASAPDLALALSNVAHLAIDQRRFDDARSAAAEAHGISERALGPTHDSTIGYALLAAFTQAREDDPEGSIDVHRRALDLVLRAYGSETPHARVLDARFGYGAALGDAGRYDEAVAELSQVLQQVQALMGADASMGGFVLASLARYELARGNPAASLVHAEQSLAIKRGEVAEDSYAMAMAQFHVARAQLALHATGPALQALQIARQAMARTRGAQSPQVGDLELMRARALALEGRLSEARQVAAPWADLLRGQGNPVLKVRALHTLALLARWSGDTATAASLIEQAAAALPPGRGSAPLREAVGAEQARQAVDRGDAAAALALLARLRYPAPSAPVATPDGAERRLVEGRAQLLGGAPEAALPHLQAVVDYWRARRPGSRWAGEAEHWLAVALARAGQPVAAAAARDSARKALRASPFEADASLLRGAEYARR